MIASSQTTVAQIQQELSDGKRIQLIDVRTPAEFREKHASIATNIPLHGIDPESIKQSQTESDQPIYLICHKGDRSKMACQKLRDAGIANAISIEGGTAAWEEAGLALVYGKKAISIERQVRIGAGFLVLAGVALSIWVSPYLIGLSAFVGAGLMFAGITDTCGMAMILARMPWNRA